MKKKIDLEAEAKKSIKKNAEGGNFSVDGFMAFDGKSDKVDIQSIVKNQFQERRLMVSNGDNVITFDNCDSRVPNGPDFLFFSQTAGIGLNETVARYFGDNFFIGWNACALLSQASPLMSRSCSIPGEDAVAVGWEIEKVLGDKLSKLEAKKLVKDSIELDICESLRKLDFNKRVFGAGIAIPCFEEEDIDMSVPLMDYMSLKGKHFIGWSIVDPYWLTPVLDERSSLDPSYKDYFKPTWWRIQYHGSGSPRDIHKSWFIQVNNTVVPDIYKPTYYYGGVPLTQLVYRRLYSATKVANEAQMLAMSKRLLVMEANMAKMATRPEYAKQVMENLKYNRDNWGILPVPKDTKVQQVDTYLTEFNQLIMTQFQLFCSEVQIPATKLLKVMPTGFQSTGDYEMKDYWSNERNIQNNEFRPILERTYRIMSATKGLDNQFEIAFGEFDIASKTEASRINLDNAKAEKQQADARAAELLAKAKLDKKSIVDEV